MDLKYLHEKKFYEKLKLFNNLEKLTIEPIIPDSKYSLDFSKTQIATFSDPLDPKYFASNVWIKFEKLRSVSIKLKTSH